MTSPVRVFIGCDGNGTDAESLAVLEYTIRKHASLPVEIEFMRLTRDPESFWYSNGRHGWQTERWATPFSAFRWGIPAACGFKGRAIYVDSDFMVMGDIADLWSQDMGGKVILGKPGSWRFCMSLWDCEKARDHLWPIEKLRSDPRAHAEMGKRFQNPNLVGHWQGEWNVLDCNGFDDPRDPRIKAHHYTSINSQLHHGHAAKRLAAAGVRHWFDGQITNHGRADYQALFDELLGEAIAAGYTVSRYVPNDLFGDYRKASLVNYRRRA